MRLSSSAVLTGLALASALALTPAHAQTVDSGFEVQVNPIGPGGGNLLLYPGGQYLRVVPVSLRHPAEAPLIRGARVASAAPAPRRVAPAPAPAPVAPPPRVASVAPPPARPAAPPPQTSTSNVLSNLPTISLAPQPQAKPDLPVTQATASIDGLAKQGVILFAKDADSPAESAIADIRFLAEKLNGALSRPQSRVEVMAYGGNKGDKGSDARRLTLKRALAIRQILIDAGVSSARINVHAQGGVDDSGPADRVDVFIRA
jgi:outer membrane protein OmpA-like peptidoglycan-associated protein